jgi:GDP-L-fucose synthase
MQTHSRIYVAGHRGLAGSAICRELTARGFSDVLVRTHSDLDLADSAAVQKL